MRTPALPLSGDYGPTAPVPFAATRHIPPGIQPNLGIPVNRVIPGVGPMANAFYQVALQYQNTLEVALLQANQTLNWYGAAIPGLMNLKNNRG